VIQSPCSSSSWFDTGAPLVVTALRADMQATYSRVNSDDTTNDSPHSNNENVTSSSSQRYYMTLTTIVIVACIGTYYFSQQQTSSSLIVGGTSLQCSPTSPLPACLCNATHDDDDEEDDDLIINNNHHTNRWLPPDPNPYPTAHRSLVGMYDWPEMHGYDNDADTSALMAQAELDRPRAPGVRYYHYMKWIQFPDVTPLQVAAYDAFEDGLGQRVAVNQSRLLNRTQLYRLERLRECIDVLLMQGKWSSRRKSAKALMSWKWSSLAVERCKFRIFTRQELASMYQGSLCSFHS
jgi:hypothetical protein